MVARRRKRTVEELERLGRGAMRASSRLPSEERPTRYTAPGLQAARLAAGMSLEQVSDISGYSVGVIASMESGQPFHTLSISRASSAIPNADLRLIRDEGE